MHILIKNGEATYCGVKGAALYGLITVKRLGLTDKIIAALINTYELYHTVSKYTTLSPNASNIFLENPIIMI